MKQASVGFHCPDCAKTGKQRVIRGPIAFDPVATKVLIGLNVAAFIVAGVWGQSFTGLGFEPLQRFSLFGPLVDDGEWYRLVTSAFLHDGLLHLGFNMWALWVMGPHLERIFQPARFVGLYTVSLLGGSFVALLLDPLAPAVGASGAVFGLFGAMAILQRSAGMSFWDSGLGPILLTFAIPQISIGGHVGGLAVGLLAGTILVHAIRTRRSPSWALGALASMVVVLVFASAWAASLWMNPIL